MKKILITGKTSYVGTNVGAYLSSQGLKVDYISLRDDNWRTLDLSIYDVIYHVAGLAHVPYSIKNALMYKQVNTDLTIDLAIKAKKAGIPHFIFMSSIMVYGDRISKITRNTQPSPSNSYGQSKLDAENGLLELQSNDFNVSIIRAPMIYGAHSKGNFLKLRNLALKTPVFPKIMNQRSMLYIDNLSMFIEYVINEPLKDTYTPHNREDSKTFQLVQWIREAHDKKTPLTRLFNPMIHVLMMFFSPFKKLFGSLYYDFDDDVLTKFISLKESIVLIEGLHEK